MALQKGQQAPNFTLKNQNGEERSLSEILKKGSMVLFFFPKAFTRVCTQEACSFGDQIERFESVNAQVFGISTDSVSTLKRFEKKHGLTYELLSDEKGKIAKKYDAYVPIMGISSRVTYVIDTYGSIIEVYSGMFQAAPHIQKALKSLAV